MENLLNDSSFELFHNSEGAKILGWDRTLMKYPDEKNSFDVFMGFVDENKDGKDDKSGKTKEELDQEIKEKADREEKIKQYASISKDAIQTGQAVTGAVKSFQTQQQQNIKSACGRKPLRKKNRTTYDKCVENYLANISASGGDTGDNKSSETEEKKPKNNTVKYVIAGVIILGLIGGFIYLKKTGKI